MVAIFPAHAATPECKLGTVGYQLLCRLADANTPLPLNDVLPPKTVMGVAWQTYVEARLATGRAPSLFELSRRVLEDSTALNGYVDNLLVSLPATNSQAPPAEVRTQLLQVALCPLLLVDSGELRDSPPCTFSKLTPRQITHRAVIVKLLNQTHGGKCPTEVCLAPPQLPIDVMTTLIDWAPALEAEMARLPNCGGSDVAACMHALSASTIETATLVAWQAQIADWVAMDGDRCLVDVGLNAGINMSIPWAPPGGGVNASLVAELWQSADQTPRHNLANRIGKWRQVAGSIRRGQFDAALLARSCTAPVKDAAKRFLGDAVAPTLDANGHLPAHTWRMQDGYVDFVTNGGGPLAAMRLRYSAPPLDGRCEQAPPAGKLSLILRARSAQNQWLSREIPAGVSNIQLYGLCAPIRTLDKTVLTLSVQQLTDALRDIVPSPLRLVVTSASMNYQPGTAPGQLRLHVQGRLGIDGIPNTVDVAWDLGAPSLDLNRQALLAHARDVLQAYLQPRLGNINLSLTPPGACAGTPMPVPVERFLTLYSCLDLSHSLGIFNHLPKVLAQIELDGTGRYRVRLSPPALNAIKEPLLTYVRKQVADYMSGRVGTALSALTLDAIPGGFRVRVPVRLTLTDDVTFDWSVSVDLNFIGGESVKEQIGHQLRDLEQNKARLLEMGRGDAMRRFNEALQRFDLPGVKVKNVDWNAQGINLVLSTPIPKLGEIPLFVSLRSDNLFNSLQEAALKGIAGRLKGQEINYAGLKLKDLSVAATPWRITAIAVFDQSLGLVATVTLPLGGDFLPQIDPSDIQSALGGVLAGQLNKLAGELTGQVPPLQVAWVNNIPQIRFEVTSKLDIVGSLPFKGTLTALLTQRDGLQLETITVKCTALDCWYPVSFFEVGGFSLTANPRKLAGLRFEATAALPKAPATMKLMRLDAALTVDDPVKLDAKLILLDSWDVGQYSAILDINRQQLEMQGTMILPVLNLKFSETKILLDAQHCVMVASFRHDFVGIDAELQAGLRYSKCGDLSTADSSVQQLLAVCGDAARASLAVCARGNANILGSSLDFTLAIPLQPLGSPVAHARLEVLTIDLEAEIRKSHVRLHASAGGLASITLIMPPLGHFTRHQVEDLLKKALKPKLSWDAFKKRELVLSVLPSGTSDQQAPPGNDASPATGADYLQSAHDAAQSGTTTRPPSPPVRTSSNEMATGYAGGPVVHIDCVHNQLYLGDGTDIANSWNISPEVCRPGGYRDGFLVNSTTLGSEANSIAVFCHAITCDLSKPMFVSQLEPAGSSATPVGRSFNLSDPVSALFEKSHDQALRNLGNLLWSFGEAQLNAASTRDWDHADALCVGRETVHDSSSACSQALVLVGQRSWFIDGTSDNRELQPVSEGSWIALLLARRGRNAPPLQTAFGEQLTAVTRIAGYAVDGDALILAPAKGEGPWSRWSVDDKGQWKVTDWKQLAEFDYGYSTAIYTVANSSARALVANVVMKPVAGEYCILHRSGTSQCTNNGSKRVTRSLLVVTDKQGRAHVATASPRCLLERAREWHEKGLLRDISLTRVENGVLRNVSLPRDEAYFLLMLNQEIFLWRNRYFTVLRADPSQLYVQCDTSEQ
jgi:hypothetical protein